MISQKSQDPEISYIRALVPRSLVGCGEKIKGGNVTSEGLCPLEINFKDGLVANIRPIERTKEDSLKILLPRLVEPHAHIDKAFTWNKFPNLSGTYRGALEANLREHKTRTKELVLLRAERALKLSSLNGFRAIRSHVDSLGTCSDLTWEALIELKQEWRKLIHLELVALVPLNYWVTNEGYLLANKVSKEGGVLGGVLIPPLKKENTRDDLFNLFKLANELGCPVDLHIDESAEEPCAGLKEVIYVLDRMNINVPISCSHLSSMGLLKPRDLDQFAKKLSKHHINVVALPLTNAWLLGRKEGITAVSKPIAPIAQLQYAGVEVAIGGDNVRDPWFPGGNFDPLMLMALSMPIAQLAPWHRFGITPFTTAPARIMNLEWDGIIEIGSPADFIFLEANNWSEALSMHINRKVIVNGKFLKDSFYQINLETKDSL